MATLHNEFLIKRMRLRNRLVLPPLTTNYAAADGHVTDKIIQFYGRRSRDVGLVIVEATAVRADGRLVPRSLGLWEKTHIEGMNRLAAIIRRNGAVAVVQLNHAGARCVPSGGEMQGASPSGIPLNPSVEAFSMTQAHIEEMISDFASAAWRALEAGFDGIEIHGAHLYLISQFLSPLTNKRADRYGGDVKGRATFALETVKAVREKVGASYPIFFRLNIVENVEGGQSLEEAITASLLLADAGVDILDLSLITEAKWKEINGRRFLLPASALPRGERPGAAIPLMAKVREATGLPVIGVGKLGIGSVAADAIGASQIDMAAIGRQMIADPDTGRKLLEGKSDEIIPCEECMFCFGTIRSGKPLQCKVNKTMQQDGKMVDRFL